MIETQNTFGKILTLVLIGVLIIISIFIFVVLGDDFESVDESFNETVLNSSGIQTSLEGTPTSFTVQAYNQTWIDCDGNNDNLIINPNTNDTLAFWYNSSISEQWQFVVNVMGIKYTNGTQIDPNEYPVHWNGTDYFFCQTDGSTFWEGSIDEVGIYEGQLNITQINELYASGR